MNAMENAIVATIAIPARETRRSRGSTPATDKARKGSAGTR